MNEGGLLLVNKPSGPTSYDVIRWIKRSVKGVKIGHCGTLDPLASGLLVVLLGRATKKQSTIMGREKTYRCLLRLGAQTDSGDITGQPGATAPVPTFSTERLRDVFSTFVGAKEQVPPMHSALKVGGRPLYKLAREGKTVERPKRPITVLAIEFLGLSGNGDVDFRVRCSSGTYVRTLAEDIARALGTVGTLAGLVRESVGEFGVGEAVAGEELRESSAERIWSLVKELN